MALESDPVVTPANAARKARPLARE